MSYFITAKIEEGKHISCHVEGGVKLKSIGKYGDSSIASLYEAEDERLEVSLGMETNFDSDDGELRAAGWNGCEEHVAQFCWVSRQGGTLIFKPGSVYVSDDNYGKFNDVEIKIQIVYTPDVLIPGVLIPGVLIPRQAAKKKKKSWLDIIRKAA